jgi:hypothetical protein
MSPRMHAWRPSASEKRMVMLLLGVGCLVGCAKPVPRWPTEPVGGVQGRSWDAVMPSAVSAGATREIDPRRLPEYARNDEGLNPVPQRAVLAGDDWPLQRRTTLERSRRIVIGDRGETGVFYLPERDWDGTSPQRWRRGEPVYRSWYPWQR